MNKTIFSSLLLHSAEDAQVLVAVGDGDVDALQTLKLPLEKVARLPCCVVYISPWKHTSSWKDY